MCRILPRIKQIALNEGITIGALERIIGASKGVLSRAIANGTDIQSKWLEAIVENYPQYSAQWILTGVGDMLQAKPTDTQATEIPSPAPPKGPEHQDGVWAYIQQKDKEIGRLNKEIGDLREETGRLKARIEELERVPRVHPSPITEAEEISSRPVLQNS